MKKWAVIYTRFSPRRNAAGCESCEQQREGCEKFCAGQGLAVRGCFEDRALSGADEDRPGLWAAVAALKKRDALVVWKFDRLARDVALFFAVERQVLKLKCRLISASGEQEITDAMEPGQKLQYQLLALFAEYERRVIAARTSLAMRRHQLNGRRMSHRLPYGYAQDPDDPGRLIQEPREQVIIGLLAVKAAQGRGLRQIARELTAEGHLYRGEKPWHPANVQRVLDRQARQGAPVRRGSLGARE